jgi:hypothetical protein
MQVDCFRQSSKRSKRSPLGRQDGWPLFRKRPGAVDAAPDVSLAIATAWWFPAAILAVVYLLIIRRHYTSKVNVSKDNQGLY